MRTSLISVNLEELQGPEPCGGHERIPSAPRAEGILFLTTPVSLGMPSQTPRHSDLWRGVSLSIEG
jgi:hypothetical protein